MKCKIRNISRIKRDITCILKGPIHQEDITILNVYAPNNKVFKNIKQKFIGLKEN